MSEPGRLVKVMVPSHLVRGMDAFITATPDYSGRGDVIADAIAGFLAEVGQPVVEEPPLPGFDSNGDRGLPLPMIGDLLPPELAASAMTLAAPPPAAASLDSHLSQPRNEFTWGMHNRDFPTLWAAAHLGGSCADGAPIGFDTWAKSVVNHAWRVALPLVGDKRFDLTGFPTNTAKWAKTGDRFRSFFVGHADGTGPLFDLGLAAMTPDGTCAITPACRQLLDALEGWACRRDDAVDSEARAAWLTHLAQWAPSDMAMFSSVVSAIADGHDTRDALLDTIGKGPNNGWSVSQTSTNVAGAVSRLREVGLVESRQSKGRYVLSGDAGWAKQKLDAAMREGAKA